MALLLRSASQPDSPTVLFFNLHCTLLLTFRLLKLRTLSALSYLFQLLLIFNFLIILLFIYFCLEISTLSPLYLAHVVTP